MKKTMRKSMLLLLAFAMLFTLAACGGAPADDVESEPEMTVETLLEKTAAAMENREMTAAHAAVVMNADITAEGETMNMAMDMSMDLLSSTEPYATYMDMDYTVTMMDETMTESYEMYMAVEDDKVMAYYYMESYDSWASMEVGGVDQIANAAKTDYSWLLAKSDAVLADSTEMVDGREVYVLDLTISGEEMDAVVGSMQSTMESSGMGDMDLTGMDVPVTLRIDAELFDIVEMDIDMMSMEDVMNDMIASMGGLSENGSDGVVINEFTYIFSGLGYDTVDVPAVPEAAKEAAVAMDPSI